MPNIPRSHFKREALRCTRKPVSSKTRHKKRSHMFVTKHADIAKGPPLNPAGCRLIGTRLRP